jgi:ubiquinone/menaquinone biosynthesis C-methylase UbiE
MTDQKQAYYSDPEVVRAYEQRRFQRGGGQYVAAIETATVRTLLARIPLSQNAVGLDCPTGTGRFLPLLLERGVRPLAIDISPAMLDLAGRVSGVKCIRASADALPLPDESIAVWLMSRFAFHFHDLRAFFKEAGRVLAPGGALIVDIYHWTPRQWIPGDQKSLGGRVHTHSMKNVAGWCEEARLKIVAQERTFLLAPYLYGFMPGFVPRLLDRCADALAPRCKTKSYLLAEKR